MSNPAEQLEGKTLENGWLVVKKLERSPDATGGAFSIGYIVRNKQGRKAFLKAIPIGEAKDAIDSIDHLQKMLDAFRYERTICRLCRGNHFSRIVAPLADGVYKGDNTSLDQHVPYLVFELADGDIRKQLNLLTEFDAAWAFRTLHHVAIGLNQLHSNAVLHTDVKPSNVMWFNEQGSKIGDLGRSTMEGAAAPHDYRVYTGDYTYAPPDVLYGHPHPSPSTARRAVDLYQLGNLAVFLFARNNLTSLIVEEMGAERHWRAWQGSWVDAKPHVRDAFGRAIGRVESAIAEPHRNQLMEAVLQLCEPEPELRGHPLNRGHNQYSLERFISRFDVLARQAEIALKGLKG
jgi:eukaryotic-like serine/threonine-protein kinase